MRKIYINFIPLESIKKINNKACIVVYEKIRKNVMRRKEKMEEVRLQKFMAGCGIASRRKCEELILQGKVKVNGKTINELGIKVNPQKDEVIFNGKQIKIAEDKVYILLNKPIEYVTTAHDQFERKNVLELIKGINKRIVPVGRLDMYTSRSININK